MTGKNPKLEIKESKESKIVKVWKEIEKKHLNVCDLTALENLAIMKHSIDQ